MIEIIKHGKRKYYFTCPKCGCEFTTDGEEIYPEEHSKSMNAPQVINCPECGFKIRIGEASDVVYTGSKDFKPFYTHTDYAYNPMDRFNWPDCKNCPNKPDMSKLMVTGDTPCNWCNKNQPTCNTVSTGSTTQSNMECLNEWEKNLENRKALEDYDNKK